MELRRASNEWSKRPADQRFKSLEELHEFCEASRATAKVATLPLSGMRVEADDGDIKLLGKANIPATFTNWAFGQLCQKLQAPAGYLRQLPATLAAQNINHGLAKVNDSEPSKLYFHNGTTPLRLHAITSEKYTRIFDNDITRRLLDLSRETNWQPAPAAFDGSRGLYASDHDLFAFMVDNTRRIFEKDPNGGLSRGFFMWNSEVGAASFGIMSFLYEYVCGNHIVWGASGVQELRIRHVGNADDRAFSELRGELRRYSDSSATELEEKITHAKTVELGKDKNAVLDALFGKIAGLSKRDAADSFDLAEQHISWYGAPTTVWGMVNGITHLAKDLPHADERVKLERAAGKVMEIAF